MTVICTVYRQKIADNNLVSKAAYGALAKALAVFDLQITEWAQWSQGNKKHNLYYDKVREVVLWRHISINDKT